MSHGTLADEIRRNLGELSPAERKVARVILAGYPSAGLETVASVAERAGVSGPTVLRFAGRLGFGGFPEFQAALRSEMQEREASPLSLYEAAGVPPGDSDEGTLLARSGATFSTAVARTLAELPAHDLETTVTLLGDPKRRIVLRGGRFTHLLARYLGLHLMQMRDAVLLLPDRDVERTAALSGLDRRDVVVVFDYRRYEPDALALAQLAAERGGKVIVFTDTWLSPASAHADVVLPSRVSSTSPYDSLVPSLAVIETVVAHVLAALGPSAHDHLRRTEATARHIGLV
ncbi:MurR/RpiR family transcriptional regulator [Streptomyces tirandamycinicus]|uniref:MurR/RpiR family transcriptional regulator n=1 Tax=Streptomyces tirandamycinicus TaxID=2174846 RepID=UPI00227056AD|nr:MurR/RpiR family transcriptional regulator [Streptomyces tirandamycinicus]MCY0985422.1 MurR/RpiR family transcriptional regulator [Streptomyces tirandamycinicus]